MTALELILLFALAQAPGRVEPAVAPPRPADCQEWRSCRDLALAAADRRDYETFHDLAWRAVQAGPKNDADLMLMLARAQALSGRPHDALVMLGRLVERGVAVDVSGDEFVQTRLLPQWPELEARMAGRSTVAPASAPAASPATTASRSPAATASRPSTSPAPAPAPAPSMSVVTLPPGPVAVRFSMRPFAVSGLAYDAASRRFVVGDRLGRRLIAVDEGANPPADLVRADSAGFLDIAAIDVDGKRGDLWVASAASGTGTLHRLQLVSGRPLRAFHFEQPSAFVDLAVTRNGSVVVLDAMAPQLLVLRQGGTALERAVALDVPDPLSVAAGLEDNVVFVAHRDGVSRVDLRTRTVSRVTLSLDHIERIRWQGDGLLAVQDATVDPSGSRRLFRLQMNARGTAVTHVTRLDVAGSGKGPSFMTVSNDELVYVTTLTGLTGGDSSAGAPSGSSAAASTQIEFAVQRVPLR